MTYSMKPDPARSTLASAVAAALLLLAAPAMAQQAAAPDASAIHALQIAAGPLDAALEQLARKAGLTLTYQAGELRGLHSAGLAGSHDAKRHCACCWPAAA